MAVDEQLTPMETIARFVNWLAYGWPADCCLELRILPRQGPPLVGFYTCDAVGRTQATHAALYWGTGLGQVYAGCNPRRAVLFDVARNRLTRTRRAGREEDVLAVTTVLVDLDPARPKGVPSTQEELEAARSVARRIDAWWREQGWHPPLVVMSGNGFHLLAKVPPQDPAEFPAYVRAFLADLADRFGIPGVSVDCGVGDCPRISKVAGTVSVKGISDAERPWRRASIAAWSHPTPVPCLAAYMRSLTPVQHFGRARAKRQGTEATMGAAAQPDLARPDAPSLKPRTLLPHILSRCQFAKWCADNPEKVKEPSWYALAANLCVFEGGEEAFYKLSEGYPAYDPREAERKFWHAAKDSPGPITCQHLAGLGEMGFQCPRLGVCPARSPAALANVSDQEWDALFPPEGTSTDFVKAARLAAAVHLARQGQTRRAIELATTVLRTPQIARQLVHHQASLGKGPGTGRAGG